MNRVHTCIPETIPGCILKQKFPKLLDSDTLGHAKTFVLSSAIDATITPVSSKATPLPYAMKEHVEKEVKKLSSLVVLQPCTTADIDWASPHVVSWRKNGKICLSYDLREVKKAIKKDPHPLPNIESTINSIIISKVYSKMDFSFHQVPADSNNERLLAFILPCGLNKFLRAPFGL